MPTVYLDTSHFSILERVSVRDPSRFERFLDFWHRANAEVVFSKNHLIELRRHDDAAVRRQRYKIVQDLAPVQTDVEPLSFPHVRTPRAVDREIIAALQKVGTVSPHELGTAEQRFYNDVLPFRHATADEVRYLTAYEDPTFGSWVKRAREVSTFEVKNWEREAGTKYSPGRIDRLSDTPLSPSEVADRLAALNESLSDRKVLDDYRLLWPGASDQEIQGRLRPGMEKFIRRSGEISPARAWLELHEIEPGGPSDRRRLDVAAQEQAFKRDIELALYEHLLIDDQNGIEWAKQAITLEDCPGMWLVRAVERELVSGTPIPVPSDTDDLEHLIYLPYVDVFLADKRITDFTTRVMARPSVPPSVASLKPPLRVPRDIDALESALAGTLGIRL